MIMKKKNYLRDHSRLFKKICSHVCTYYVILLIETDLNIFPKPTAVVIPRSFGIPDRLKKYGKLL